MWRVVVDIVLLMVVYGVTLSQKPPSDNISTFLTPAKKRRKQMFLMRCVVKYAQMSALLSNLPIGQSYLSYKIIMVFCLYPRWSMITFNQHVQQSH